MKAIGFFHPGPIEAQDALVDIELPTPELRPHDLLVRVQAISVNPVDAKVRTRPHTLEGQARVLGYDAVGVVEATGSEARRFKKGDAVFYAGALDRPGSNAELLGRMLQVCEDACRICGQECERHAQTMPHCRICADACRRCEIACRDAARAMTPALQ